MLKQLDGVWCLRLERGTGQKVKETSSGERMISCAYSSHRDRWSGFCLILLVGKHTKAADGLNLERRDDPDGYRKRYWTLVIRRFNRKHITDDPI